MSEKNKKIFINILVVQTGILFIIAVLEIAVRIFPDVELEINNPYKYTEIKGEVRLGIALHSYSEIYPLRFDKRGYYRKSNGVIDYNFNQFGARWIESREQKLRGKTVVVVGDSFTYGFGLRYEDAYIFKLQNLLYKDKLYLDFINFSEPAANSQTCLDIYREKRNDMPHDMLIYGLHLNDLIEFSTSHVNCNIYRYDSWIRKKSKLADLILKKIEKKKSRRKNIKGLISPLRFETTYFTDNMNAIKQMNLEARQQDVDFFIVILPILVDVKEGAFTQVYDKIKRIFDRYGIKYFDLTPSVMAHDDDLNLWILPFDQHPNETANAIFARALSILLKTKSKEGADGSKRKRGN